jgi:DNA modification methylase
MSIQTEMVLSTNPPSALSDTRRERLIALLSDDLDFHTESDEHPRHRIHSFPAKFPPQLPRHLIQHLTEPGELVCDPMMGSGTTLLEAHLLGRQTVGIDIDPLALRIAQAKLSRMPSGLVLKTGIELLEAAKAQSRTSLTALMEHYTNRFDEPTRKFLEYWFLPDTRLALLALAGQLDQVSDPALHGMLEVLFSSIIITKSGGVSLAFDLAHTRPHRAKRVRDRNGAILFEESASHITPERLKLLTKTQRDPFDEFEKRLRSFSSLSALNPDARLLSHTLEGSARTLPLSDHCVDLIVTSPPYAANAIDYMRAHKFSLVWLGYSIDGLSQLRRQYVGSEAAFEEQAHTLPKSVLLLCDQIAEQDKRKARVVRQYYIEMQQALAEYYRVLRPGRAAVLVVGNSIIRGINTLVESCLTDIGLELGFEAPAIGIRRIDRNKRMLPAGKITDTGSQIQQRMHEEYVIGFFKPESA